MNRTQTLTKEQHAGIWQEIKKLRSQNITMWRELSDAPNIQFLVKTDKHKRQLDLNAKFRKNEARLKHLHCKIGRDWVPTTDLPNRALDAAFLAAFVTIFSVITLVIVQAVRAFF